MFNNQETREIKKEILRLTRRIETLERDRLTKEGVTSWAEKRMIVLEEYVVNLLKTQQRILDYLNVELKTTPENTRLVKRR